MKESFDEAFAFSIGMEGGLHYEPRGGWTNFGFCERAHPGLDIRGLTLDRAKALARSEYWDACFCDQLVYPLDIVMFDTAFNMGAAAAHSLRARSEDINSFLWERVRYYAVEIPGDAPDGWFMRCYRLFKKYGRSKTIVQNGCCVRVDGQQVKEG